MRGSGYRPAQQHKKTTRHYINTLIMRGKVTRQPCVYCGGTPTEFNHFSYEARSTNGEFVCKCHHVMAHRIVRNLLTVFKELEYQSICA